MVSVSPFKIDDELQYGKIPSDTPFGKISGGKNSKEAQLLTKFDEQLAAYKREIEPYHTIWDECDKAFTGYKTSLNTKDIKNRYRANLRVWYAYKQVESQRSKILPAFFNFKPPYTVFPNDDNSEIREMKARGAQKEMDYDFFQRQNAYDLLNRWVQQAEIRGFSPLKSFWDYEEGSKRIRRPIIDEETGEVELDLENLRPLSEVIVRDILAVSEFFLTASKMREMQIAFSATRNPDIKKKMDKLQHILTKRDTIVNGAI